MDPYLCIHIMDNLKHFSIAILIFRSRSVSLFLSLSLLFLLSLSSPCKFFLLFARLSSSFSLLLFFFLSPSLSPTFFLYIHLFLSFSKLCSLSVLYTANLFPCSHSQIKLFVLRSLISRYTNLISRQYFCSTNFHLASNSAASYIHAFEKHIKVKVNFMIKSNHIKQKIQLISLK